ncbi:hypothetical protein COCON_G00221430 [Conger conger]|uniref:FHA domain-containing protein n=1 Tax=Conger conger TaxID=82655 RepID=A0A9Q1CVW3_CONCO|nr:hypothetical protein COCON_G00221430 [Conger conger]
MSLTSWFLVSSGGTRHRLPREMIFVGRDDCELMLQSRSVDKQHAVINYEAASDQHKVKDLGSLNGTFVNDTRIQEQMYFTLKMDDKLRFGYDILFSTTLLLSEAASLWQAVHSGGFPAMATAPPPLCSRGPLQLCLLGRHYLPSMLTSSRAAGLHSHTNLFTVVRGELQVPEEALKHEKFSSQLQLSKKPSNGESPKTAKSPVATPPESKAVEGASEGPSKPADPHKGEEKMAGDIAALHRGTPLYGQPSWWGDDDADDENSFKQETKSSSKKLENGGAGSGEAQRCESAKDDGMCSLSSEPSYFEIPSKEAQKVESSIHEVPTKDTEGVAVTSATAVAPPAGARATPPSPSSSTAPPPGRKSSLQGGPALSSLQAAIMASESKVADWLAQTHPPLAHREAGRQDGQSVQSDMVAQLRRLKGSKHEDGTQSDSENVAGPRLGSRRPAVEDRLQTGPGRAGQGVARGREGTGPVSRKAFMIEFFDEANPRKRRSYSFSQTAPLLGEGPSPTPPSRRGPGDCSQGGVSAGVASAMAAVAPTAARLLLKQRSEDPSAPGRGPTPAAQQTGPADQPKTAPRPTEKDHEDDQSDKGTYTIELDKPSAEEDEARRMIDKVFGVEGNHDPTKTKTGRPEHLQEDAKARQTSGTGETKPPGCSGSEILPEDMVAVGNSSWVSQWASLAANHTRTDPEGSGGETLAFVQEKEADASESGQSAVGSGHTERRRRALPQLPGEGRSSSSIGEKQDTEPQEKEGQSSLRDRPPRAGPRGAAGATATQAKPTPGRPPGGGETRAEDLQAEDKKPLVRQGSFTVEKPSAHVSQALIPRIAQGPPSRQRSDSGGSMDTVALLRDTEAVMAFLEARLRDGGETDPRRPPRPACPAPPGPRRPGRAQERPKRRTLSSLHKEKSSAAASAGAREPLERRPKPRPSAPPGPRHRQPSLDLTDDDITSSLPHSAFSSDQEAGSARSGRALTSTDDLLQSKMAAGARAGSGPRPRPTRTSMLRRARLGDASDTELGDADRASVASEVSTTSSTSKQPSGRKALSRIDLLAQPRRTRAPLSTRSDSEATAPRGSARVSAETALRLGLRSGAAADAKPPARLRANSVTKLPDAKAKPPASLHSASPAPSRWRRLPPEYASTSEDEFGSNRSSQKPGRLRPAAPCGGPVWGAPPLPRPAAPGS